MTEEKESFSRNKRKELAEEEQLPEAQQSSTSSRGFVRLLVAISRPFLVRGLRLPWSLWLLGNIPASEQAWIGRMKIAYEIQTADYSLRFGPLWLRRLFESLSVRLIENRFWLIAGWKVLISFLLLAVPFALFLLYRAFLPFPDDLLQEGRTGAFGAVGTVNKGWRVSSPYERVPLRDQPVSDLLPVEARYNLPGFESGPALEKGGHFFGLQTIKVSDDERATSEIRAAFVLQEGQTERFLLREKLSAEVAGDNVVAGSFVVVSRSGLPVRCRLEIKDDAGSVLVSTEKSAPPPRSLAGTFSALSRSLFKGNALLAGPSAWESFSVSRSVLPSELRVSVSQIHHAGAAGLPGDDGSGPNAGDCLCAFSGPQVLTRRITPLLPHALLLVLIDGGAERLSREPDLMPNLNDLANLGGRWRRYFNQHLSASENFHQLLTGENGSQQIEPEKTLFSTARKNGYQTLYFGEWDDLVGRRLSDHLFPGTVWQVGVPFYKGLGAALQFRNWVAGHLSEPFFAVVRLSDVQNRLIPPWKFLSIDQFLTAPIGVEGRTSRYEAMLRYMDAALSQVIETAQLLARTAVVDVVVTSPSGFQFESRYNRLSNGLLPAKGATFKVSGPLTPDLVHVPFLYARLGAVATSEATGGRRVISESFRLSSPGDAHRLLADILAGRTFTTDLGTHDEADVQHAPWQMPAAKPQRTQRMLTISDAGHMGLLAELPESRQMVFWSQSTAEPGEQIYTHTFPYRVPLHSGLVERAFVYDPETGSSVALPARDGLSPFALKESFRRLMNRDHEPALILRGTGPVQIVLKGMEATERTGAEGTVWDTASGGSAFWKTGESGSELRYSVERGLPYLVTLGRSLFSADRDIRLELTGGAFEICGQLFPSAVRSTWHAADVRFFLDDPPHCSVLPARVPAAENGSGPLPLRASGGRPGAPLPVEVLAGWSVKDEAGARACEGEKCFQRVP